MPKLNQSLGTVLRGVGVSPGIVLGNAVRYDRAAAPVEHVHLPDSLLDAEVSRLQEAVSRAEAEIDRIDQSVVASGQITGEHLSVLEAHKVMLRDPMLLGETERHIREQCLNAEWALELTLERLMDIFSHMEDAFFRDRATDVRHVGELLLRALRGEELHQRVLQEVPGGTVVVTTDLSPTEALTLSRRPVAGFVLDTGTATSHTAIIAQGMGIPAVLGVGNATEHVGDGDRIILDGGEGEVIVHPSQDEELVYERRSKRKKAFLRALRQNRDQPAATKDRSRLVTLRGNLDVLDECHRVGDAGGEGVGLFRTEFLFLGRTTLPSEAEQFEAYAHVLEQMAPYPVTIRTLDVGGDKQLSVGDSQVPASPDLRAIRYCLRDQKVFRTQLRALLRASVHGELRILLPLVTTCDEVRQVKQLLARVRTELESEGHAVADEVPLGLMIEVPAAAMITDLLAREADFLSVGTNDLIQYVLAISRVDSAVGYLYQPLHPAMLRLLRKICEDAHQAGIPISMCGEMAGDPRYSLVLLALGFDELSMNAASIPLVKEIIRRSDMEDAERLVARLRDFSLVDEVTDFVDSYMVEHFSDIVTPRMREAPRYAR